MNTIEIQGLTKDYGGGKGIFDLSFSIREGEAFGYLGPNGAGKTTTIRHLMGFLRPQAGTCRIGGLDCFRNASEIQRRLGYIPGETSFLEEMMGEGFLRFLAEYRGLSDFTRAKELMERFELNPKSRLKRMSKGMKQKIALVAAFMHDPAVLILDEPTSGLDPLMQSRFIRLVQEEKARGKTILMSSHMFEEVERTCDRVGILRGGRLAAVDSVETLKKAQRKRYSLVFADEAEAGAFLQEGFPVEAQEGRRVTVSAPGNLSPFFAALSRRKVSSLDAVSQTLEEVFLEYYGGDAHV